jgi:hypothetical protein
MFCCRQWGLCCFRLPCCRFAGRSLVVASVPLLLGLSVSVLIGSGIFEIFLAIRNISRHANACLFCSGWSGLLWSGLIFSVLLLLLVVLSLSLSLSVSCFWSVGGFIISLYGFLVGFWYPPGSVRCLTLRS